MNDGRNMAFSGWNLVLLFEFAPREGGTCKFDLYEIASELSDEKKVKDLPVEGSVNKGSTSWLIQPPYM